MMAVPIAAILSVHTPVTMRLHLRRGEKDCSFIHIGMAVELSNRRDKRAGRAMNIPVAIVIKCWLNEASIWRGPEINGAGLTAQ